MDSMGSDLAERRVTRRPLRGAPALEGGRCETQLPCVRDETSVAQEDYPLLRRR
jgi:hypothetical protein